MKLSNSRLSYLVAGAGYFYEGHRAANDCLAAIELLAALLPRSNVPGLSHLFGLTDILYQGRREVIAWPPPDLGVLGTGWMSVARAVCTQ
jgi:hypothetical protein